MSRDNQSSADNQQETLNGILRDYTSDTATHISSDAATLIGMLYTDGCLSPHGVHSWRIYFANTSWQAIMLFKQTIINCFGISPARVTTKRRVQKGRHIFCGIVTSKEIGAYLTQRFGTFRTLRFSDGSYPKTQLPITELKNSGAVNLFLRTAFTMDGGIKFYPVHDRHKGTSWLERNVFLSCHHPALRKQYCELLDHLNISAKNVESDNMIKILGRNNIEKYFENIGFIAGIAVTSHSKYWEGTPKQQVLEMALQSYASPSSYLSLPNFCSKDIVRSL